MRAAPAIVPPLAGLPPSGHERLRDLVICQTTAIRRVRAAETARHRHSFWKPALYPDGPQAEERLLRRAIANRCEDHALAIGRPAPHAIERRMIREPFRFAARRGHNV